MKKFIIILLFLPIVCFGERQPRKLGYIKVDSILFVDETSQITGFDEDTLSYYVLYSDSNTYYVTPSQLNDSLVNYVPYSDSLSLYVTISQLNDSLANYMDITETDDSIRAIVSDSVQLRLLKTDFGDSLNNYDLGIPFIDQKAKAIPFLNTTADSLDIDSVALNFTKATDSLWFKKGGTENLVIENTIGKIVYISSTLDTTEAGTWKHEISGDTLIRSVYTGTVWNVVQKLINE